MSFLIDTDTCSAHLRQKGAVTSRFLQYTGRLHISVVTLGELLTWAMRANARKTDGFAGEVVGRCRGAGRDCRRSPGIRPSEGQADGRRTARPRLGLADRGHGVAHGLTLVTHNPATSPRPQPDRGRLANPIDWSTICRYRLANRSRFGYYGDSGAQP